MTSLLEMGFLVNNISIRADDWTTERMIIASNFSLIPANAAC